MKCKSEQETLVTVTGLSVYTTDIQLTFILEPGIFSAIKLKRDRLPYQSGSQPPLQKGTN